MKRTAFFLIFLLFILIPVMAQETAPDKLFYQAVYAEQVDGDLTKAKALYEQILKSKPDDRTLTAKTLYRLGLIGEKEGTQKALGYYTKVIEQYPEQKDVIEMVQTRVDKLDNAKTFIDSRDGHKYKWVKIGNQIWMAENLAYMPHVNPPKKQESGIWVYDYDGQDIAAAKATENYQKYGCLYSWTTALAIDEKYLTQPWKGDTINHQGICPSGWHMPTDTEWKELEMALGMPDSVAMEEGFGRAGTFSNLLFLYEYPPVGRFLKSSSNWLSDGNGNNSSGFNALPGGAIYTKGGVGGGFNSLGTYTSYWSSSEVLERNRKDSIVGYSAWTRDLMSLNHKDDIYRLNWDDRAFGHSVRCIKDYKGEYPLVVIEVHQAKEYIKPDTHKEKFITTGSPDAGAKIRAKSVVNQSDIILSETEKILKASDVYNSKNWTKFGRDLHNTGFTDSKVSQIQPVSEKKYLAGTSIKYAVIADDRIFCNGLDSILHVIDFNSGASLWKFKAEALIFSSPVVSKGTIIFGSEDLGARPDSTKIYGNKFLYALNIENGKEIWKIKKGKGSSWNPVVHNEKVFVGNGNEFLALDIKTGKEIWKYSLPEGIGTIETGAAISNDMVIFGASRKIIALNISTGALQWESDVKTMVFSSPAIFEGKVFFGGSDHYFYALDLKTGERIWRFYTDKSFIWSSPGVAYNSVYFGGGDGSFYCLTANTGELVWKYTHTGEKWMNTHPAIADGLVIFGLNDSKVMALDAHTGQLIWEYAADKVKFFSPLIYKGKVIVGSSDGLYVLE